VYLGPLSQCCPAFDYVEVYLTFRFIAVCLSCGHVFEDLEVRPTDQDWFCFTPGVKIRSQEGADGLSKVQEENVFLG
jgi:hypothetical protein